MINNLAATMALVVVVAVAVVVRVSSIIHAGGSVCTLCATGTVFFFLFLSLFFDLHWKTLIFAVYKEVVTDFFVLHAFSKQVFYLQVFSLLTKFLFKMALEKTLCMCI